MQMIRVGDIEMRVEDRGSGPLLLLVHGFPLDHTMWSGQLTSLSDVCRVVAPDLRGFGETSARNGILSMRRHADDLVRLLEALEIREPITLCGLSMGGYVAWQFWRWYADRLDKLILCDTRAAGDSPEAAEKRLEAAEDVLAHGTAGFANAMIPKLFSQRTIDQRPEIVEATRQVMLNTSGKSIAGAQRGMAERPDMSSELGQIDVPALVLVGEHDAISPVEEMRSIAEAMPHAEFCIVPDAGHLSPLENPDFVNQAIHRFVMAG